MHKYAKPTTNKNVDQQLITFLKKIRFIFQVSVIAAIILFDSLMVMFNVTFRSKHYNFFRHYRRWAGRVLWVSGIKLKIKGEENIKSGETYIFASNHSSQFDIPILFRSVKSEIRIIYKKELEKIPIFGWQLKKSPFIAVIRDDPRKAMRSIEEAAETIKNNMNVIIFPEGTRSPDGKVAEFKRGAFMLAYKSRKPILPVTIIGSNKIMPKGHLYFEPKEVNIIFHPPVYFPDDKSKETEKQIIEEVRAAIISGFPE